MTKHYVYDPKTLITYRGYRIALFNHYTPGKYITNPISGSVYQEGGTETKHKPKWAAEGPLLGSDTQHETIEDCKNHVDYTIEFGEKYYNWTDSDRTGHLIKRKTHK